MLAGLQARMILLAMVHIEGTWYAGLSGPCFALAAGWPTGNGKSFFRTQKKLWSKFSLKKIVEVQISPHTPKSVQFTCTARFCFRKYLEIISS
jgi:hypothetical protein